MNRITLSISALAVISLISCGRETSTVTPSQQEIRAALDENSIISLENILTGERDVKLAQDENVLMSTVTTRPGPGTPVPPKPPACVGTSPTVSVTGTCPAPKWPASGLAVEKEVCGNHILSAKLNCAAPCKSTTTNIACVYSGTPAQFANREGKCVAPAKLNPANPIKCQK